MVNYWYAFQYYKILLFVILHLFHYLSKPCLYVMFKLYFQHLLFLHFYYFISLLWRFNNLHYSIYMYSYNLLIFIHIIFLSAIVAFQTNLLIHGHSRLTIFSVHTNSRCPCYSNPCLNPFDASWSCTWCVLVNLGGSEGVEKYWHLLFESSIAECPPEEWFSGVPQRPSVLFKEN